MQTVEVQVVLDGVQGDGPVQLRLLQGAREGLRAAAVMVQNVPHLQETRKRNKASGNNHSLGISLARRVVSWKLPPTEQVL